MSQFQPFRLLLAASLLAFTAILGSLLSGSVDLSFSDLMSYVLGDLPDLQRQVFEDIRLPRTLAAFVTGAALALAGVLMQVLLRNPLADPYILGLSGGAAVGALASIMLSSTAFVGALISVGVVFGIASRAGSWSTTHLLLTGVVVSAGWGALINLMLSTSASASVQGMLFWLMGDLSQSSVGPAQIGVLVVGAALAMRAARSLNVLVRGDLVAASLGVDIKRLRLSLFFGASLLTVIAVTTAGSVGFVGLVVPHMLPVGVITALIGVPSFIAILRSTPSK